MNDKEFEDELKSLNKPKLRNPGHMETIKLTVLNTKRSAIAGSWLIAIPCIFLFMVCMKYIFGINIGLFDWIENIFVSLDKYKYAYIVNPILFIILPLTGLAINLLAICHFSFNRTAKEFGITVKLKWKNITIALISFLCVAVILTYLFTENYVLK